VKNRKNNRKFSAGPLVLGGVRRLELAGEQLTHRREVDERLTQGPVGADLALTERSAGADHGGEPRLERVLVCAPVAVETLLASDLASDPGWRLRGQGRILERLAAPEDCNPTAHNSLTQNITDAAASVANRLL
jgi:hypothetical protein